MGKEYMGIKRSTFLIDTQGNIAYIWSNVKVKAILLLLGNTEFGLCLTLSFISYQLSVIIISYQFTDH